MLDFLLLFEGKWEENPEKFSILFNNFFVSGKIKKKLFSKNTIFK
jgi:hypothetical protein